MPNPIVWLFGNAQKHLHLPNKESFNPVPVLLQEAHTSGAAKY